MSTPNESPADPGEARPSRLASTLETAQEFWALDPLTLSASMAFYTSLSFAPLVALALTALGALPVEANDAFRSEVAQLMGPQVGRALDQVAAQAQGMKIGANWGGLITLLALAFSATSVFGQLQAALNRIWQMPTTQLGWRDWLRSRLLSLGMMAALGFLLLSSLIASAALAALAKFIPAQGWLLAAAASIGLLSLAFAGVYRFVTDARPQWRGALVGGLVTALLFEAGKWALSLYLSRSEVADIYGAAGALILLLLWAYYTSLAVLVGAFTTRWMGMRWGWWTTPAEAKAEG
jgi:membrane protein